MNRIEVKSVKTPYNYDEYYWVIDDIPITTYLDQQKPNSLSIFSSLLGLLPAWSGKLVWPWENDFVWELANGQEELNVPILVCEDDCDLSCIVIVAHIRKEEDVVYWDRIGRLDHSNTVAQEYNRSGILCLETYTDDDWERYGDNIALETYGSSAYWEWVAQNTYEENIRRLRNYLKPYMQNERNIEWIWSPNWAFGRKDYEAMLCQYQKLKSCQ